LIRGLANNIPDVKIATWKINGVRGRLPLLLKWLAKTKPDGVALLALKADPVLIRKALPGDPDDKASRHIEAAVDGVLFACLYIPNGNPQPGPRSVCKLDWFDRLIVHARTLKKSAAPVVLL
jgi:exodeoxyribonuclease III